MTFDDDENVHLLGAVNNLSNQNQLGRGKGGSAPDPNDLANN